MLKTPINEISELFDIPADIDDDKFLKYICRILDGKDDSYRTDSQECSTVNQIYENYCVVNSINRKNENGK